MYDTSSSQGYAASAAADAGAPFYNEAGITFGNSDLGAVSLSNTPTLSPSASASPTAATTEGSATVTPAIANAGATAQSSGNAAAAGSSSSTLLLVVIGATILAGGVGWYVLKHHK